MATNYSTATFGAGQRVYFIENNVPATDLIKEVISVLADNNNDDSAEQADSYKLATKGETIYPGSILYSSKANLITAVTNAANALT